MESKQRTTAHAKTDAGHAGEQSSQSQFNNHFGYGGCNKKQKEIQTMSQTQQLIYNSRDLLGYIFDYGDAYDDVRAWACINKTATVASKMKRSIWERAWNSIVLNEELCVSTMGRLWHHISARAEFLARIRKCILCRSYVPRALSCRYLFQGSTAWVCQDCAACKQDSLFERVNRAIIRRNFLRNS